MAESRLTQIDMESSLRGDVAHSRSRSTSQYIIRLQIVTLLWMVVECGASLFSAYQAKSPALLAFGSDSFVELLSATVVILQFAGSFRLSPERATRISGILLFLLGGVVFLESITTLVQDRRPETSWIGMGVTIAALVIMPLLARAKRVAARSTGNRALEADAVQSSTCAYLAAITLAGLLANAAVHIHWIDPIAALLALPIICIEGAKALRGQACGCCS